MPISAPLLAIGAPRRRGATVRRAGARARAVLADRVHRARAFITRARSRASRGAAALLLALALLATGAAPALAQRPCGVPGKDGPGGVLSGVVNTYFPAATLGVLAANSTSIAVGAATAGTTGITPGDLLLVIQMQDATIDARDNQNYGSGTGSGAGALSWDGSGLYEYVVATGTVGLAGGTIGVRGAGAAGGLVNAYTNADASATSGQRRYQVIRVPQYASATLSSGLTAAAWNGRTGGVLAIDVAGQLTLGGAVSVDGLGFRGGAGRQLGGGAGGTNSDYRTLATLGFHGSKGEGLAGTPHYVFDGLTMTNTGAEGYPNGSMARGAPANAGGGSNDGRPTTNDENGGGGGGGGAGAGGIGGNVESSNLPLGGRGGAAFPVPAAAGSRVVMGGGGGAGTTNNGTGALAAGLSTSGARGGGVVLMRAGSVTGAGAITANGANADNSVLNDGSGGGGGGGTVVVYAASGGLAGLSVSARGGNGGTNTGTGTPHGPGGGGGGGYIVLSGAAATDVSGGTPGLTAGNVAFGAAVGSPGVVATVAAATLAAQIAGANPSPACLPALTVTKTTSTPNVIAGNTATYTITVANAAGSGTALGVALSDTLPAGMTYASALAPVLTGGATRPATINPAAGDAVPTFGTFELPGGGQVTVTMTVTVSGRAAPGTRQNTALAGYLDPVRLTTTGTVTAASNAAGSTAEDVTVTGIADLRVAKTHSGDFVIGQQGSYSLAVTNAGYAATAGVITVVDTLPAGLSYASAAGTAWTCVAVGQVVTCTTAGALGAGASAATITLTVGVAAAAAPAVTNVARVSGGGEAAVNADDNASSDATSVVSVAVAVTPDAGAVSQLPSNGTQYTQTFTITNGGSAADVFALAAAGVPGTAVTIVAVDGVAGSTGSASVPAGSSVTVTITYAVAAAAAAGATDVVQLTATSGTSGGVSDAGDVTVTVVRAAVTMTKDLFRDDGTTAIGAGDRVGPGEYVRYRVTVTGAGGASATTVSVTDVLPAETTFDSATGDAPGWTIAYAAGTVTAGLSGTLANGDSRHFWLRVRVK
jgi:uncharacterized repeat protein (TIGR01451 family)